MVVGLIQGVTELFPVSSLGHNVLIPALIGGSWAQDLNVSKPESPYHTGHPVRAERRHEPAIRVSCHRESLRIWQSQLICRRGHRAQLHS
ncbi:MAG TPA: undecaprenyl-diphosphate phosphatase [Trebonia sp.]